MIGLSFLIPAACEGSIFTAWSLTVILQGVNFSLKRNEQIICFLPIYLKTCGAGVNLFGDKWKNLIGFCFLFTLLGTVIELLYPAFLKLRKYKILFETCTIIGPFCIC